MALFGLLPSAPPEGLGNPNSATQLDYNKAKADGTLMDATLTDGSVIQVAPDSPLLVNNPTIVSIKPHTSSLPTVGAPPVSIDTTTGAGVPGGFDGASLKHPTDEATKANASISTITAAQSKLTAAANSPCVLSGKITIPGLTDSISSLKGQLSAYQVKLNVALKAPNFSKTIPLPSPPRLPSVPKLNLPNIPSDPCIKVPVIPQIPKTS
jgi:hypothetical protein